MCQGRTVKLRWRPAQLVVGLLLTTAVQAAGWSDQQGSRNMLQEDEGEDTDAYGPGVQDLESESGAGPVDEITRQVNSTEKKTIAQMIDEALEQEFPEEKQEGIGKNYNETAKNADVRSQPIRQPHIVPTEALRQHCCIKMAMI